MSQPTNSPKSTTDKLYQICPTCNGTGQAWTEKAECLGMKLPCPKCKLRRVVPVETGTITTTSIHGETTDYRAIPVPPPVPSTRHRSRRARPYSAFPDFVEELGEE
jgi:hypothetical protein